MKTLIQKIVSMVRRRHVHQIMPRPQSENNGRMNSMMSQDELDQY